MSLTLHAISFGYGHNDTPPADLTVDVQHWFRDPHIDPALRQMTGHDHPVIDKVLGTHGVEAFSAALFGAIVALGASNPDRPVTVAVGCVGGRHRSVVIAEYLAGMARSSGWDADVTHLHVDRPVIQRGR
jgi:UPF0042 nucleotide-binding protein